MMLGCDHEARELVLHTWKVDCMCLVWELVLHWLAVTLGAKKWDVKYRCQALSGVLLRAWELVW